MKNSFSDRAKKAAVSLLRILAVIFIAFLLNAVILMITGKSVESVYSSLWKGAFSDLYNIARSIRWSIPLIFTALAFAISARAGIFNCGAEGQLIVGAFAAAWAGFTFPDLPGFLLIPLCCIAAMIAGALWSIIAGLIMIRFKVNIIVVTLMLNYIAELFAEYLTRYPFYEGGSLAAAGSTAYISENAYLSTLIPDSQVTTGLLIALFACIVIWFFNNRLLKGYETRLIGANERFAVFSGINVNAGKLLIFALCGALSGLGGAVEVCGIYHRYLIGSVSGFGFDGIVISLLSGGNPLFIPVASLFMGALTSGSITVEMFGGVPKSMTDILMGIIIMLLTIKSFGGWDRIKTLWHKLPRRKAMGRNCNKSL